MNVMIHTAAGRRGAGSIDCKLCSEKIHERPNEPGVWYDGSGETGDLGPLSGAWPAHAHTPAEEMGPTFGPFEYAEVTYLSVRVDEGRELAVWDERRGDWVLTDLAGDHAGEAYSDLTINTQDSV